MGKSKHRRGSKHPRAKLNEHLVRQIRATYVKGKRHCGRRVLANRYGVSTQAIYFIVSGKTWAHVTTDNDKETKGETKEKSNG